jgi:hypothetical protein
MSGSIGRRDPSSRGADGERRRLRATARGPGAGRSPSARDPHKRRDTTGNRRHEPAMKGRTVRLYWSKGPFITKPRRRRSDRPERQRGDRAPGEARPPGTRRVCPSPTAKPNPRPTGPPRHRQRDRRRQPTGTEGHGREEGAGQCRAEISSLTIEARHCAAPSDPQGRSDNATTQQTTSTWTTRHARPRISRRVDSSPPGRQRQESVDPSTRARQADNATGQRTRRREPARPTRPRLTCAPAARQRDTGPRRTSMERGATETGVPGA